MNSPIEVEIAKADGSPITKAAVHPGPKGSAVTITDGKAYFTMDEPALIAVDINGQMDDHDTGRDQFAKAYDGPPIHAVSIFAHPIFEKPDTTIAGVTVIQPGETPPSDPGTFNTLYFAPGVHNIGKDYQVHKNKEYYIPGDAIVYGTMGNHDQDNGMNIHIYGVGTISGDSLKHPEFDPDFPGYPDAEANPINGRPWKPISIIDAEGTLVEGICIANPAFHALSIPTNVKGRKVTTVRWAKVISWRGNGDGFGNPHIVEDCFLRTQDDAFYVKGDRRRCVIWNDANGAAFVFSSIPDDFPILIEDCDVIYSRARWHLWSGGRVFSGRPINGSGKKQVNVLVRNVRIEDPRPTLQIFYMLSKNDISDDLIGTPSDYIGTSWSGITIQNITAAGKSVVGHPEIFHGCAESPYSNFTFDSMTIDGKLLTSLDDFAEVNEYVTDIHFNPGIVDDATLFDLYLDGVSLPGFNPSTENYTVNLEFGTLDAPLITATQSDYGAEISISQAEGVPGTATITVTAEDDTTIKIYRVSFTAEGSDKIIGLEVPEEFSPRDTIIVSVTYSATSSQDIQVLLKNMNDSETKYGESKVTVPAGVGVEDIELIVAPNTPLLLNAYKITVNLFPEGGSFSSVLDIMKVYNLDVVSPYSSNAALSGITVGGISLEAFDPGVTVYDIVLPYNTADVPVVEVLAADEGAPEITDAVSLPGSTTILVTAEDSVTSQIYTLNFLIEGISGLTFPESVTQGETVTVPVSYAAAFLLDLVVVLEQNKSPYTSYGEASNGTLRIGHNRY
ncbi:MAG: cadherin-like beta sandwich domain-containing protein [Bacteroidales bacterium]|nr:cadherin-like beta sandwich domain-containing protein [Bacteroidales bacterium]